jgi:hypothetical protein
MELIDYLRIARRRLLVLILVPVLAVGLASAYVLMSPAQYSATASLSTTAFVGGAFNQFTGPQAASQFAAQFTASATGPPVLNQVSQSTQIPVKDLKDGLTVSQTGASSDMTLQFTWSKQGQILPALRAVNAATLDNMFGLQVQLAQSQVKKAQVEVVAANKNLQQATAQYGPNDPITVYRTELSRVAVNSLTTAQTAYQIAQSQLSAAQAADILYVSSVTPVSRVQALIRTDIAVLAASIFLAVILVFMLELLASAHRQSREESASRMLRRWPEPTE